MRQNNKYIIETKLKAVKLYLRDGVSASEIAKKLKIRDVKRVRIWSKKYEEYGRSGLESKTGKSPKSEFPRIGRPRTKFKSIEEQMEYLRTENAYLRQIMNLPDPEKKRPNSK